MVDGPRPAAPDPDRRPRVFVSYAQDSAEHADDVLRLCQLLRRHGVDPWVDRWNLAERHDWGTVTETEMLAADHVLAVASPAYRQAGNGQPGTVEHRGARSETTVLRELLHQDRDTWTRRILPVVLPGGSWLDIPTFLQPSTGTRFEIPALTPAGLEDLLRFLTGQARYEPPSPGPAPVLPPRRLRAAPVPSGGGRPVLPLLDRYSLVARWTPMLLVLLPVALLLGFVLLSGTTPAARIGASALTVSLALVGALVVRDRGLRVQESLFAVWGGRPSEQLLRWRSGAPRSAVRHRHRLVEQVLGMTLPDEAAEAADPAEADAAYDSASVAARGQTRDRARFPLLFQDNVTYGFWRNAYACRGVGTGSCAVAAAAAVGLDRSDWVSLGRPDLVTLLAVDVVVAAVWVLLITEGAVRRAADAYARQLFAALEVLAAGSPEER